jgi:hypothetical protein
MRARQTYHGILQLDLATGSRHIRLGWTCDMSFKLNRRTLRPESTPDTDLPKLCIIITISRRQEWCISILHPKADETEKR